VLASEVRAPLRLPPAAARVVIRITPLRMRRTAAGWFRGSYSGTMSDTWDSSTQVLAERLRLGAGFGPADRRHVLDLLSSLTRHLARWKPDKVDLEISVKDRGGPEQKVTLEALLPGLAVIVATSADRDLDHAVVEARKELIRQIDDEKAKRSGHRAQEPPPPR